METAGQLWRQEGDWAGQELNEQQEEDRVWVIPRGKGEVRKDSGRGREDSAVKGMTAD